MLIPFYLQTIMLFLWESEYVNSFLFTNYHDLGFQGNNLGGALAGMAARLLLMLAAGYGPQVSSV